MAREVPCPRCGTRREWSGNPFRPFCSERCKLIDLGDWASERYRVAAQEKEPDPDEDADKPREGL